MRALLIIIITVFVATSSFAAELSETDVKAFLADWLAAQNTGSYSTYAEMYSKDFSGIRRSGTTTRKLNHDAWLKERKRMFKKKMVVQAIISEIQLSGQSASIKFEQTYESGSYKDKGDKLLTIGIEDKKIIIIKEVMLFSEVVEAKNHFKSEFTSISASACKKSKMLIDFLGEEYASECPAIGKWRLFKVYDNEGRSYINIAHDSYLWNPLYIISYDTKYNFGYFPHIDKFKTVEWILNHLENPHALIIGVNAQSRTNNTDISRFIVVTLSGDVPKICGMTETRQEAREIAYTRSNCIEILDKKTLPKKQ